MQYRYTTFALYLTLFFGCLTIDIFQENALTPTENWSISKLIMVTLFCVLTASTFLAYKNKL